MPVPGSSDPDDRVIRNYYSLRSGEYDLLYEKEDRQDDLRAMEKEMIRALSGRRILEIACGTGYWTEILADHAESILAIDTSSEMLDVARKRTQSKGNVKLAMGDAYSLTDVEGSFNAVFCGYFISHVKRSRIKSFLDSLAERAEKDSTIALLDNRYVNDTVTRISRKDDGGNTYQLRRLGDGREFEIVKNFLTREELIGMTSGKGHGQRYIEYSFYWTFTYST